MKRISAIFFVFIFLLHLAVSFSYVIWYEINKTYVATQLCENTNKPELHCDGKCYLKKKISPTQENSTQQSSSDTNCFQLMFFNELRKINFYTNCILLYGRFLVIEPIYISYCLLHPPEFIV